MNELASSDLNAASRSVPAIAYILPWSNVEAKWHDGVEIEIPARHKVRLEATRFLDGWPVRWAIRDVGEVLNHFGEWEEDRRASDAEDDFFSRTRWHSPGDALAAARAYFLRVDSERTLRAEAAMLVASRTRAAQE